MAHTSTFLRTIGIFCVLSTASAVMAAPAAPLILVNPTTGDVKLDFSTNGASGFSIGSYEVDATGGLIPAAWSSLVSQGVFAGKNWTAFTASSTFIGESGNNFSDSVTLNGVYDLGTIFNTSSSIANLSGFIISGDGNTVTDFAVAVPEPATFGVLGVGMVALIARRRRVA